MAASEMARRVRAFLRSRRPTASSMRRSYPICTGLISAPRILMLPVMDFDVIVVGAGPTGLVLAGELALQGVAVEVVEKQAAPSGQSRGGGVNSRTSEVLQMRGLLDEVSARAVPREGGGGHFAGLPVELDARPWRTRWPAGLMIPQDRMEAILEDRLVELGVRVRRGTEVVGVELGPDSATVSVRCPEGARSLTARFLV